jgi:general secretion pathway protein D
MQGRRKPTFGSAPNGSTLATLALLAVFLAGCVTPNGGQGGSPSAQSDFNDLIREVDLTPPTRQRVQAGPITSSKSEPRAATYNGDGSVATADSQPRTVARSAEPDPMPTGSLPDGAQAKDSNKGYELNFENTPLETVAKAILGDILGISYTIDPRAKGSVSLSSARAVPRKDLLFVLESALRMSNIALVRDAQGYRLIPTTDAVAAGGADWTGDPSAGYGISVIPLQFVSAQTLIKLLDNYAAKPGMVRAEPSRNLIIIQGSSADRRTAIQTVLSFDADWMLGQSVGIYPAMNSTPEPIIAELNRIIDAGQGGLSQDLVKLEPISRQNAILVVARRPDLLKRVATWITRLDKSGGAGTDVRVYRMRYGDARQVASLLNDMFSGTSTSGLDSPTNQLAPGGGMVASSSAKSTLGGAQQGTSPSQATSSGGSQQSSTSQPSNFDARFSGQRVAGPATWASGSGGLAGVNSAPTGAAAPLLPNVRISADVVNNDLLIYANQESYGIIKRALEQVDRPQLQVAIDATIAEVTLNDNLQYGVQFFLKSTNVGAPANTGSAVNTASSSLQTAVAGALISRVLPGFNFLVGTEAQPQVIINALHAVTDVKILSNPSLVVIDNQVATLQVGDQIPITTQSAQSVIAPGAPVVNNVDYRNTGIILKVAPRINANGNVLLHIGQEISSVADNANANTLTPTVSQRKVESTIAVASGQTVLLAGLVSETRIRSRNGIPGLDKIPVLGELTSQNNGTAQRTELIIFIRPQIIRNGIDASRVAAELRDRIIRSRQGAISSPSGMPTKQ